MKNCSPKALRKLFSENTSTISGCTKNCSLKHMHNTGEHGKLFSENICTIPGGMNLSSCCNSEKEESWGPGVIPGKGGGTSILAESRPDPGNSKGDDGEGNPRVLVLYQEECGNVIPGGEPFHSREFQTAKCVAQFQGGGDVLIHTRGSKQRWCNSQSGVYTRVAWVTANTKSNPALLVYNWSLPDFCL